MYSELNITTYHKPVYPAVIMDTLPQRRQVLTGSAIRLSDPMTQTIIALGRMEWTAKGRLTGWVPDRLSDWLKSMPMSQKPMGWLDRLSPVKCNWAGGNSSTYRGNTVAASGFDLRIAYGG